MSNLYQQAKELRSERVGLVEKSRAILDRVEGEKRAMNTEELSEYEKMQDAIEERRSRIETIETQIQAESGIGDPIDAPEPLEVVAQRDQSVAERAVAVLGSAAYRSAYRQYLARGEDALNEAERAILHNSDVAQYRVQTIGTGTGGGFATETETHNRVAVALAAEVAMRAIGTVFTLGSDREIAVVDTPADGGDAVLTAENNAYNEDDVVLEQRTLSAFKLTRLTRVSEELLADDVTDFTNAVLPALIARRFAPAEEVWFVNGTGSGQPRGVLLDAPLGKTTALNSAITADEVMDFMYSVRRPYRARSSWLMNDATVLVVRKLKGSDNNYLWRPGLEPGEPDRLLGHPVFTSDAVPVIATTAKVAAFGDFSNYWIADRGAMNVRRLVERYAELGQVGLLANRRTDGVLTVQESVKHLAMAV